jgi:hypothetical protein
MNTNNTAELLSWGGPGVLEAEPLIAPGGLDFTIEDQEIGEWTVLHKRKHWAMLILPLMILIVSAAALMIVWLIASPVLTQNTTGLKQLSIFPLISLFLLVSNLAVCLEAFGSLQNSQLRLTDQRVTLKTGFLMSSAWEIKLKEIERLWVEQSSLGRLFNYGTIVIAGQAGTQRPNTFICDPVGFKRMLQEMMRANMIESSVFHRGWDNPKVWAQLDHDPVSWP